jgi:UDP-perosamine 4-acetyltransferase
MAGAIVSAHAKIGELSIVNTRAVVDHDCEIGDCVHIAPGCTLAGNVTIGDSSLIGLGSSILPGVIVGGESIVGAGSVVLQDVPSNTTVVGVPAKEIPHQGIQPRDAATTAGITPSSPMNIPTNVSVAAS